MTRYPAAAVILLTAMNCLGAENRVFLPYEEQSGPVSHSRIDTIVLAAQHAKGIEPARVCSDEVFVRRAYLDVIGTLPTTAEVRKFLADPNPSKRALLIGSLLKRDEFTDYQTLKWCDLLRVKSEFPINLWPNAVQAYYRWIHDAVRSNMPYDRFARELLTSSGSNFRVGQVNFYRAIQGRDPCAIADAVALTFMGARAQNWPAPMRKNMATFFSRVAYKYTGEWKEEIVYCSLTDTATLDAIYPDGTKVRIEAGKDPRQVFADWLISERNPWFVKNAVNRAWAHLFGRGVINPADDIRDDSPPAIPELLTLLEDEFIQSKYDMRHLYQFILNSRTYQQSCVPRSDNPEAAALFAFYPARRLDAEVLIDALCYLGRTSETYSSNIPEPFTWVPKNKRTISLYDGSITSSFLEMFGRPTRDTGLESERSNDTTDEQRLYLVNSAEMHGRIAASTLIRGITMDNKNNIDGLTGEMYLTMLSRNPTDGERAAVQQYIKNNSLTVREGGLDLAWALINTKEFLYRH